MLTSFLPAVLVILYLLDPTNQTFVFDIQMFSPLYQIGNASRSHVVSYYKDISTTLLSKLRIIVVLQVPGKIRLLSRSFAIAQVIMVCHSVGDNHADWSL